MCRFIIIPDSDHMIHNDNPQALSNCIINEFLSFNQKNYKYLPYLSNKECENQLNMKKI